MAKKRGNLVIVIFPYLFSHEEVDLGEGYKLLPSYKNIFDKQSAQVKAHVKRLASSFAYGQYSTINQYLFGKFRVSTKKEWLKLRDVLNSFSTIVGYSELSDERSGASYSNFTYAVFEIVRPIGKHKHYFYQGYVNGSAPLQVHYPDSKYRPNIQIGPHVINEKEYLKKLMSHLYWYTNFISVDERKRIMRAISWFNKSHRLDYEIDDIERFVNLSVAFESLFNTSSEGVQAQLLTGITALLGESDEMKDWLKKFYSKRSKIVHGQEEKDTLYTAKKSSTPHIDHISYSRKVFSRCIKVLVESREKYYVHDLHDELISNERRLKEIKDVLDKTTDLKEIRKLKVYSTFSSLSNRDVSGSIKSVISVGKRLLELLDLKKMSGNTETIKKIIDKIASFKGDDYAELAVQYSDFGKEFRDYYFQDDKTQLPLGLRAALYTFSSYASWRLFHEAFKRKKKAK